MRLNRSMKVNLYTLLIVLAMILFFVVRFHFPAVFFLTVFAILGTVLIMALRMIVETFIDPCE